MNDKQQFHLLSTMYLCPLFRLGFACSSRSSVVSASELEDDGSKDAGYDLTAFCMPGSLFSELVERLERDQRPER